MGGHSARLQVALEEIPDDGCVELESDGCTLGGRLVCDVRHIGVPRLFAGSGKPTALDAAREAFEDAGYGIVGIVLRVRPPDGVAAAGIAVSIRIMLAAIVACRPRCASRDRSLRRWPARATVPCTRRPSLGPTPLRRAAAIAGQWRSEPRAVPGRAGLGVGTVSPGRSVSIRARPGRTTHSPAAA
jgi:hypothetical protein